MRQRDMVAILGPVVSVSIPIISAGLLTGWDLGWIITGTMAFVVIMAILFGKG